MSGVKVIVKYFGVVAEKVGKPEEEMTMADLAKLSLLRETIEKQYPDLEVTTYRLSVNKKLIEDCELADGDEVALLPPFAGG
ncbi:MAG: MoaD/ThiS family protein [Cyclobacteriaceae bacterium]